MWKLSLFLEVYSTTSFIPTVKWKNIISYEAKLTNHISHCFPRPFISFSYPSLYLKKKKKSLNFLKKLKTQMLRFSFSFFLVWKENYFKKKLGIHKYANNLDFEGQWNWHINMYHLIWNKVQLQRVEFITLKNKV